MCWRESKAASQRKWESRPENRNYYCGPEKVTKVRAWRAAHPGYWKRGRRQTSALPDVLITQVAAEHGKTKQDDRIALPDLWQAQTPLLVGLIAQLTGLYGFRDFRRNAIASLNETLDNMIDYGMSRHRWFVDELKGCAYSTDVPGAVKNVSSLNPLNFALVTDDEEIFRKRAYPIIEYMVSREKFLFSLDPKQKSQSLSRAMKGPCAPVSELAALYGITHGASPVLRRLAEGLMSQNRTLNLDDVSEGGSWPNQLAMYRETGEARFLAAAQRGADAYIAERIDLPAEDFNAPALFFWVGFTPEWIDFLQLYEATRDARYIEAARRGARQYTMFTWVSPRIPEEDVTVNPGGNAPVYWYLKSKGHRPMKAPEERVPAWRVSEIGLTPESSGTMSGHYLTARGRNGLYVAQW